MKKENAVEGCLREKLEAGQRLSASVTSSRLYRLFTKT